MAKGTLGRVARATTPVGLGLLAAETDKVR